jgi:hypothetical protein
LVLKARFHARDVCAHKHKNPWDIDGATTTTRRHAVNRSADHARENGDAARKKQSHEQRAIRRESCMMLDLSMHSTKNVNT